MTLPPPGNSLLKKAYYRPLGFYGPLEHEISCPISNSGRTLGGESRNIAMKLEVVAGTHTQFCIQSPEAESKIAVSLSLLVDRPIFEAENWDEAKVMVVKQNWAYTERINEAFHETRLLPSPRFEVLEATKQWLAGLVLSPTSPGHFTLHRTRAARGQHQESARQAQNSPRRGIGRLGSALCGVAPRSGLTMPRASCVSQPPLKARYALQLEDVFKLIDEAMVFGPRALPVAKVPRPRLPAGAPGETLDSERKYDMNQVKVRILWFSKMPPKPPGREVDRTHSVRQRDRVAHRIIVPIPTLLGFILSCIQNLVLL
ncbi:hypothetical protein M407DRAFT_10134 [Tulasnella calospora MUT 4182]|uniref:Uncharacterized protein n=1 Tax=Tulasnella calospora MUT 4182 TaxID=1051891 RepID=A0A0C3Q1D6_9AGAM|nr:hypothetical protein M407DRAFT_10134 [Tulasnella calospora MUT 4182]